MDNSFLHRKKLLLVDDEPELLKMVSDILKDAGFETVLTAGSVKEAVMAAKQEKPDLMILDVMLPDGDGFSLMEQLRTFTDVPVIFLTAKDEAADKLAGLGLGADDYISKPFGTKKIWLSPNAKATVQGAVKEFENNTADVMLETLILNKRLVKSNIEYLVELGVKNIYEIFSNYYELFLIDHSNFESIFNKYDREDLIEKLMKNVAIIEYL